MELPTKEEVITLMKSSKNEMEWDNNCDIVKSLHGGGYPDYWYETFVRSGLANEILHDPDATKMKIISGKDLDDIFNPLSPVSLRKKYGFED